MDTQQFSPSQLPHSIGYHMPAEWEKHEGVWLAWPHNKDTWPTQLAAVQNIWIEMIKVLHYHEKVFLLVNNETEENFVKKKLHAAGVTKNVFLYKIPTVDVWLRDSGPIFVVNREKKQLAITHWIFNAWGLKYTDLAEDTIIPKKINESLTQHLPVFTSGIVLEGGSIDVNGKGTLLTTEQCLLNKNRNPHLSKKQIEQYLKNYLGVKKIIWLKEGVAGDDTDGHVDDIARFVNPSTVVCVVEENQYDENYKALHHNYTLLKNSTDHNGKKLNVVTLPMPSKVAVHGQRLPASYANFLIANGVVLVPVFNDPNDKKALTILRKLFPERKVVGLLCRDVVYGMGAIHCVSQQQPAV